MKTPISYYGGKQQLVSKLVKLIPAHNTYTEVFFGGGSVFFAKEPAKVEAINDINRQVINFYKTAKRDFENLKSEIDCTLFSEEQFIDAKNIYKNAEEADKTNVLRAWSLFVLSHQSFLSILDNSWKFSKDRNFAETFQRKKEMFDERYMKRLERTQIFCRDANRVLQNMDGENTFHFIDPPYVGTNCGHYDGYTDADFRKLLENIEALEGKFLLTTFKTDVLDEFTKRNGWYQIELRVNSPAKTANLGKKIEKIEVFTSNYPISLDDLK